MPDMNLFGAREVGRNGGTIPNKLVDFKMVSDLGSVAMCLDDVPFSNLLDSLVK